MLQAALTAQALNDFKLAGRLARSAVDAGGGFDAEVVLGRALSLTGQAEWAEGRFAALWSQPLDDAGRARLAAARVENLCYGLGQISEGLAVAREAEALISDPARRGELAAWVVSLLDGGGETAKAIDLATTMLREGEGRGVAWAATVVVQCHARAGQLDRALDAARQARAAFEALEGPPPVWETSMLVAAQALALTILGDAAEAARLGEAEYERLLAEEPGEARAVTAGILCWTSTARGRIGSAVRWGRESVSQVREPGRVAFLRATFAGLAEALALAGEPEQAAAVLAEADELSMGGWRSFDSDLARARGWTAAAGGDLLLARQHLWEAAEVAATRGDRAVEATALHDIARLGEPKAVVERLTTLTAEIDGPLAPARADHVTGLVAGDGAGLERAAHAFLALDRLLLAAEAMADAAVAWRRAGEERKAVGAERRATDLAGGCEGARTPALETAGGVRAVLTPRELEVARLAAGGHSNKEIARICNLSVRTVENNLHLAYEKLGVSSRRALPAALGGATPNC